MHAVSTVMAPAHDTPAPRSASVHTSALARKIGAWPSLPKAKGQRIYPDFVQWDNYKTSVSMYLSAGAPGLTQCIEYAMSNPKAPLEVLYQALPTCERDIDVQWAKHIYEQREELNYVKTLMADPHNHSRTHLAGRHSGLRMVQYLAQFIVGSTPMTAALSISMGFTVEPVSHPSELYKGMSELRNAFGCG